MEAKDLDKQLSSGRLGNLYFFYGAEQFLMEHKIKSIKKRLITSDFEELNFVRLNSKKISAADISREIMAVPVMADKRIVVVEECGIFGNSKAKDFAVLNELLADLPDYLCLIFTEKEFDKKKEKNLDTIKKYGDVVKFDPLSPTQLERWLEKLFEEKGKSILSRELSSIISLAGQSMAVLYNEYCKLVSFVGDRTKITAEDVAAVVSKSTDTRIFDVIDNIAAGRSRGVFNELNALKASGENPSTVLSLISTRLGELLMVKQLLCDKLSRDKISEYFEPRRPAFVVSRLEEQSRRFGEEYLKKMTLIGPEYTALVRSGQLDKWTAVEMYAAKLLQK